MREGVVLLASVGRALHSGDEIRLEENDIPDLRVDHAFVFLELEQLCCGLPCLNLSLIELRESMSMQDAGLTWTRTVVVKRARSSSQRSRSWALLRV